MSTFVDPSGSSAGPTRQGPPPPTNQFAILSLVFAFVVAPLGIVFGIIARRQIREHGGNGHGLATAGLVLGSVFTGIGVILVVVQLVALATLTAAVSSASSPSGYGASSTAARAPAVSNALPSVPRVAATTARAAVPTGFAGTWEGQVTQRGSRTSTYSVKIVIPPNGSNFSVQYPELNCGGSMRPDAASGRKLTVTETISVNPSRCTDGTRISLTLDTSGSGMSYAFRSGTSTGTATLTRTSS